MAASAAIELVMEPREQVLVIERAFQAPRELVWEAFTKPEHLRNWMGPRHHPAVQFDADVRPGGKWRGRLRAIDDSRDLWQGGMFHEVVRPERLVYTFQWDKHDEQDVTFETLITITFEEIDEDETLMKFHQPRSTPNPTATGITKAGPAPSTGSMSCWRNWRPAMRKLVLKMSISVDGFVGGEKGSMDWAFKSMDRATAPWIAETLGQAGLHIMGSRTFQDMVAWWPTSTEIFAPPMNEIPKAVFSRSGKLGSSTQALRDAARMRADTNDAKSPSAHTWAEAEVIGGELAAGIERFKKQGGKFILAHGGASFAQSLVATGLIDEYRLVVHPCVLGTGLPLFAKIAAPLDLALVEAKTFPGGAAAHIYRPI